MQITASFEHQFERHMADLGPFPARPRVAVAVSGGVDSLALCYLLHGWLHERGGSLLALSVDHQLRPESTAEVTQVGAWMQAQGIAHQILTWQGEKPVHAIQESAREKRYELLQNACRAKAIPYLFLAHHFDDQLETFWMRFTKGSGLEGLQAMQAREYRDFGVLLRPLLGFTKDALTEWMQAQKKEWIEDPSNQNLHYQRVRVREWLGTADIDPAGVTRAIHHLQKSQEALMDALAREWLPLLRLQGGTILLDEKILASTQVVVGLRKILALFTPESYPPRFDDVETLVQKLENHPAPFKTTLHSCLIQKRAGQILIQREASSLPETTLSAGVMRFGPYQITSQLSARVKLFHPDDWAKLHHQNATLAGPRDGLWDYHGQVYACDAAGKILAFPALGMTHPDIQMVFAPAGALS